MSVKELTNDSFSQEVLKSDKTALVDFWASWCGPCKIMAPVVEDLSNEVENVKFFKVNVDEQPELAAKYNIMSIPTFIVFKDGKAVNQKLGAMQMNALKEIIGE